MEPLAPLIGTWSGRGHGEYATIDPFDYDETVTFVHTGKPFLVYTQRSTNAVTGLPTHGEAGYWRWLPSGALELVIAHPNGLAELADGTVDGPVIRFRSTSVTRTGTAKEVSVVERDFLLEGDTLSYELRMAAVGHPLARHLTASLTRV
jgi:hypothetical protein